MGRTDEQHGHGRDSSSLALADCVFRLFISIQTSNFLLRKCIRSKDYKERIAFLHSFLPQSIQHQQAQIKLSVCFVLGSETNLQHLLALKLFLESSPPRLECRQLLQEYYSGNMPKAKWWDPWGSVYHLCKWSLNIADLCLKLRLHYAQLCLLPKQLLVCWPELDLVFGSKSQKLHPQCSEDCAQETQSISQE